MRLETNAVGAPLNGSLYYRESDRAFDFIPTREIDLVSRAGSEGTASIALGTLQLELGVGTRALLYAWGYSPREKWASRALPEPNLTQAAVHIAPSFSLKRGIAVDFPDATHWSFAHDAKSGWLFFGEEPNTTALEIASNVGLVIDDGVLRGVWLRPSMES